jgi:hypothetical protein
LIHARRFTGGAVVCQVTLGHRFEHLQGLLIGLNGVAKAA